MTDTNIDDKCAWFPGKERRGWCRQNSKEWAPIAFDILDMQGIDLEIHVDALQPRFSRGLIGTDSTASFDGVFKAKEHFDCVHCDIVVTGLVGSTEPTADILEKWESWCGIDAVSGFAAKSLLFSKKNFDSYEFGRTDLSEAPLTVDRQLAIDALSVLMSGDVLLHSPMLFYSFTCNLKEALSDDIKQSLDAMAGEFPDIVHKHPTGWRFAPMGQKMQPHGGNVHASMLGKTVVWGSCLLLEIHRDSIYLLTSW